MGIEARRRHTQRDHPDPSRRRIDLRVRVPRNPSSQRALLSHLFRTFPAAPFLIRAFLRSGFWTMAQDRAKNTLLPASVERRAVLGMARCFHVRLQLH
jgi:hypothetical protein